MRTILTTFALLIILALTAALVGPSLVDWQTQRPALEARLARMLGAPVRIRGAIAVQLLPTPIFDVEQLEVGGLKGGQSQAAGDAAAAPAFVAKAAHLQLALGSLVRGAFAFDEVTFVEPELTIRRAADGGLEVPFRLGSGPLPSVRIDKLAVRNGRLRLLDARSPVPIVLENVTLEAEATSLIGPFHGSGSVRGVTAPVRFRFSTGAVTAQRLPVKLALSEGGGVPHVDLDGSLVLPRSLPAGTSANTPAVAPSFVGTLEAHASGTNGLAVSGLAVEGSAVNSAALPWTLNARLNCDTQRAELGKLDIAVGANIRTVRASGSAALDFGERPAVRAALAIKQIDLDAQAIGAQPGVLQPREALERLVPLLAARGGLGAPLAFAGRSAPVSLELRIDTAAIGGDLVSDLVGSLVETPGQPLRVKLAATAPAQTQIALDGAYAPGPAASYTGRLTFATQDRARFVAWAAQGDAAAVAALDRAMPFRAASLTGIAEISRGHVGLHDFNAALDRSRFAGTLDYTAAARGLRAKLAATITSPALDLDTLPDAASLQASGSDLDLRLALSAKGVRIASVADVEVETGELDLQLNREGDAFTLERLHVGRLRGASLEAHGAIDAKGGHLESHLAAADLAGLGALMVRFAPSALGEAIVARAHDLSPAVLDATVDLNAQRALAAVAASGTLGAAHVRASFNRDRAFAELMDTGMIDAELEVQSVDAGQLLRQFGIAGAKTVRGAIVNRLALKGHGRWGDDLAASLKGTVAGADVAWEGHYNPASGALDGKASLDSQNLVPLLRSVGSVADKTPALPAKLSATLRVALGQVALQALSGSFGGVRLSGALALASDREPDAITGLSAEARLSGRLSLDRLTLANLNSLILGPALPGAANGIWSEQRFAAVPATLPETNVDLQVAVFDLGFGVVRAAALNVGLAPGLVRIALQPAAFGGKAGVDGGTLGGSATLRRGNATVSLNGRLAAAGMSFERPFARGKLAGVLEFAGTGDSPRALVAGLAGKGSAVLSEAQFAQIDPSSVSRLVAALDAETVPLEAAAVERTLVRETTRAPVGTPRLDLPLLLASGTLRFGTSTIETSGARVAISAQVDLNRFTVALNEALTVLTAVPDWRGDPPRIAVDWSGAWAAPRRNLDSAGLFNGLSARALSVSLQKMADADADVRERAFFNHRLKVMREDDERERAEVIKRAAEDRRRAEAERRRQDEKAQAEEKQKLDAVIRGIEPPPAVAPPSFPIPAVPPNGT